MKKKHLTYIFIFSTFFMFSQINSSLFVSGTLTIIEKVDYSNHAVRQYRQKINIDSINKSPFNNDNECIDYLFYTPIDSEINGFQHINYDNKDSIKFFQYKFKKSDLFDSKFLDNKYVYYDSIRGYKYRKYKIKGFCKYRIFNDKYFKIKNSELLEFYYDAQAFIKDIPQNNIVQLCFIYRFESIEPIEYN